MADIQNEPTGKVESQGKLTNQIGSVDERKKQFKCEICDYSSSQKATLIDMLHQYMRKRNQINVRLVISVVLQSPT